MSNSESETPAPEPWLRGPIPNVHPLVMPVFFTFAQVREDLAKYTAGIEQDQLWKRIDGASLGFHLKHIAGSAERLTTYLVGRQLSRQQLSAVRAEAEPDGCTLSDLLAGIEKSLRASEEQLRGIDPDTLYEARRVGRRELPTTVIGLIVHLCEHTQRHLGQAITTCKILRQMT